MHCTKYRNIRLPQTAAFKLAALAAVVVTLAVNPLEAQTSSSGNATSGWLNADGKLGLTLSTQYDHMFPGTLKKGAIGDMTISNSETDLKFARDWDVNHLTFSTGYTYTNYDFSGMAPLFGNVQRWDTNVFYGRYIADGWGAFALVDGGYAAETATSLFNGGQITVALGPSFSFSKDFTIYGGASFSTRLEDSGLVLPVVGLNWQINPNLHLRTFDGPYNGATVTYDIFADGQTVLDATLEYDSNWFRARPIPGATVAVNERHAAINFGARQTLWKDYFLRLYVEGQFLRSYQFHDNGGSANSFETNPSAGLGVQIGVNF